MIDVKDHAYIHSHSGWRTTVASRLVFSAVLELEVDLINVNPALDADLDNRGESVSIGHSSATAVCINTPRGAPVGSPLG
jgi:hypothetical protein